MKYLSVLIFSAVISQLATAEKVEVSQEEQAKVFQMIGHDINQLSKTGAGYSLETLNKTNKLPPFALIMNNDGTIGKLEPLLPFIKNAPIADKINYLRGQVKNLAELDKIKAGGVFSRGFGRTEDKSQEVAGLIIELEHRNGPSTVQFVPLDNKNGQLVAMSATSTPKPRLFFNKAISSDTTYKQIKEVIGQAE